MRRKIIFLGLLWGLGLGWWRPNLDAQAGSPQTQEFMGGGVNNLIVYPASLQTEAEIIRDSASEALSKLVALFTRSTGPLGFETQVRVVNESRPDAGADALLVAPDYANSQTGINHTFGTPRVCDVAVYQGGFANLTTIPFYLAHEIAHCMQQFYLRDTVGESAAWWVEGTAEWVATLTYPDIAGEALPEGVAPDEIVFLATNNVPLTDSVSHRSGYEGYGSVYFWLYLITAGGLDVIEVLRRVPTAGGGEEAYQDFLAAEMDSAEAMQVFGRLLAQNSIPFQPHYSALFENVQEINLPASVQLSPNDFTLDFNGYDIRGGEEVKAVEISSRGLGDLSNDIRVAINAGGIYTLLDDGAPLLICLEAGRVFVESVVSRGDGDGAGAVTINFTPITDETGEDTPCTEQLEPGDLRTYPGWRAVDQADSSKAEERVLFVDVDENTTFEVWNGPDILYTRSGGTGPFSGVTLPDEGYDFVTSLEIQDARTRVSFSTLTLPAFTSESNYVYTLTDEQYYLMTEVNRLLIDYSMFSTCIGFAVTEPGRQWTTPDLLVPMRNDEMLGVLFLGGKGYTGGGNFFSETTVEESPTMGGTLETTFTVTLSFDQIAHIRYESVLDGRADCRIIYESMLVPFNGDFAQLLGRVDEIEGE